MVRPPTCSAKVRTWAGGVVAAQPADPQPDQHLLAADGRVGQRARVAAVDLGRRLTAPVAAGASGARGGPDPHATAGQLDVLDGHACQVRKEVIEGLAFTCRAWSLALLPAGVGSITESGPDPTIGVSHAVATIT
jgi:hypothetical protein